MGSGAKKENLCNAIGLSIRTIQRWQNGNLIDKRKGPKDHPKSLSTKEEKEIIKILNSDPFYDHSPYNVFSMLSDQGKYFCSVSTMYRLLRRENLLSHRGRGKRPMQSKKIETIATGPN